MSIATIDSMEHKVLNMVNNITSKIKSSYGHIMKTSLFAMDARIAAVVEEDQYWW